MGIQKQQLTIEGAVTYSRLFDALKGMYEVDDDDSVWEIFSQADDQIEEVVNALKLLSAPPAPVDLVALVPDVLTLAEDTTPQQFESLASGGDKKQTCPHCDKVIGLND